MLLIIRLPQFFILFFFFQKKKFTFWFYTILYFFLYCFYQFAWFNVCKFYWKPFSVNSRMWKFTFENSHPWKNPFANFCYLFNYYIVDDKKIRSYWKESQYRSSHPEVFYKKMCLYKFRKIHLSLFFTRCQRSIPLFLKCSFLGLHWCFTALKISDWFMSNPETKHMNVQSFSSQSYVTFNAIISQILFGSV